MAVEDKLTPPLEREGEWIWYLYEQVQAMRPAIHQMTVSGAVPANVESVELSHASDVIAATIASAKSHKGLFIVKNTSSGGTASHTLTLTAGTWNGTNNVATLDAPNEALVVYFDNSGNGTIIENVNGVSLS